MRAFLLFCLTTSLFACALDVTGDGIPHPAATPTAPRVIDAGQTPPPSAGGKGSAGSTTAPSLGTGEDDASAPDDPDASTPDATAPPPAPVDAAAPTGDSANKGPGKHG